MVLIDSYADASGVSQALQALHPSVNVAGSAAGQSFTMLPTNHKLTSCKFYLVKGGGNPTGNAYAVLYAHGGVYGVSSVPTGLPLATSDPFDVSTLGVFAWITFTFSGVNQYPMTAGTKYCIVFQNPTVGTIDFVNYPAFGLDIIDAHSGNYFIYANGAWTPTGAWDGGFYVYGDPILAGPKGTIALQAKIAEII